LVTLILRWPSLVANCAQNHTFASWYGRAGATSVRRLHPCLPRTHNAVGARYANGRDGGWSGCWSEDASCFACHALRTSRFVLVRRARSRSRSIAIPAPTQQSRSNGARRRGARPGTSWPRESRRRLRQEVCSRASIRRWRCRSIRAPLRRKRAAECPTEMSNRGRLAVRVIGCVLDSVRTSRRRCERRLSDVLGCARSDRSAIRRRFGPNGSRQTDPAVAERSACRRPDRQTRGPGALRASRWPQD